MKSGVLLATGGLMPSSMGARLKSSGGKVTVTDGPFTETKELIASYALIQAQSKEEAVGWGKRFFQLIGDGELEIRQVASSWYAVPNHGRSSLSGSTINSASGLRAGWRFALVMCPLFLDAPAVPEARLVPGPRRRSMIGRFLLPIKICMGLGPVTMEILTGSRRKYPGGVWKRVGPSLSGDPTGPCKRLHRAVSRASYQHLHSGFSVGGAKLCKS